MRYANFIFNDFCIFYLAYQKLVFSYSELMYLLNHNIFHRKFLSLIIKFIIIFKLQTMDILSIAAFQRKGDKIWRIYT